MENDLEVHRKMMGKMEKNFLSLVDLLLTSVYSEFFHTYYRFSQLVALIFIPLTINIQVIDNALFRRRNQ